MVSALIRQRQRLSNIIEGTDVGTWEWNIQTGETVFDGRWAEMLGYSLEDLKPLSIKTWEELVHPEDMSRVQETLDRHLEGRLETFESDYRMRRKDGNWVWVTDRGKVLEWDDDGRPLLMFGMHTDITERKRAELEQQLLLDLMEHSCSEICVFDLDSLRFTRVSRGAQESLGYSLDELASMTPVELQPGLSEEEYREMLRPLVEGERNRVQFTTVHRRKSGESYPVEVHLSYHAENRLFLAVTIDITEREAAQAELHKVQERYRRLPKTLPT